jgi:hypothetical protein
MLDMRCPPIRLRGWAYALAGMAKRITLLAPNEGIRKVNPDKADNKAINPIPARHPKDEPPTLRACSLRTRFFLRLTCITSIVSLDLIISDISWEIIFSLT